MKKIVSILVLLILLAMLAIPGVVLADTRTALGGLDLDAYCASLGYANSTLTKPQIGPSAAFNNWRCVSSAGKTHPFSMEQACKWKFDLEAVQAHPLDRDDAYTWVCYSVAH